MSDHVSILNNADWNTGFRYHNFLLSPPFPPALSVSAQGGETPYTDFNAKLFNSCTPAVPLSTTFQSSSDPCCAACRSGIELVLNSKVQSVSKNCVSVAGPGGHVVDIPFGACVWATGVAMSPLVKQLQVGGVVRYCSLALRELWSG